MKKILLTAVTVALMATTSMADTWYEGTVGKVNSLDDGSFVVQVIDGVADKYLYISAPTADTQKQMVAIALTAKASGLPVRMFEVGNRWQRIMIP